MATDTLEFHMEDKELNLGVAQQAANSEEIIHDITACGVHH